MYWGPKISEKSPSITNVERAVELTSSFSFDVCRLCPKCGNHPHIPKVRACAADL